MIAFNLIGLLLLLVSTQCSVVQLSSTNFHEVSKDDVWLIMFYAPWCQYSQRLFDVYEEVGSELNGLIKIGIVDVSINQPIGSKFNISGFPMVKVYHQGKSYAFQGRRSREELVDFAMGNYRAHEPEEVREYVGFLADILYTYHLATKQARQDLLAGKYLTIDVYLTVFPLLACLSIVTILSLMPKPPSTSEREKLKRRLE